ncbi:aldehyde dehydrogenase (NADP(+)) [Sphingomonas sp. 35-24ZXX]|uniref:aldehyde dehydrogenase (NADP(+)) n=1 Tax=Sphingomonas sp. 35-24ZXX TaxID=1545915 RepID=UPI00068E8F8E|nr:aldehyde dehydrogenase (NADP(+)) [Sphingomonas sp. 35-24ZXX]
MTTLRSINPITGDAFCADFPVHEESDVERACILAEAAFDTYRAADHEVRARLLETIAEQILAIGDPLIEAAVRESGLPRARIEGERGRTIGQLRMFAEVVRAGNWLQVRIDPAQPDRTPLPRPDIRMRMIPLGPVAVFGASNFPLAFSTAGGDTASALAAGCPVVVKGHPAHPVTGMLVASAISRAVVECGLPEGVFQHLVGPSHELGAALVRNPRISAVGFTGSRAGGLALLTIAQARPVPIPFYAEMSSINPVLILPAALKARGAELGAQFISSLTMGAGQFCTNPGLIIAIAGDGLDAFTQAAIEAVQAAPAQVMLTGAIRDTYVAHTGALASHDALVTLACSVDSGDALRAGSYLFRTTAAQFLVEPGLGHEVFGASSMLIVCDDVGEQMAVLNALEGQLTATLHMEAGDHEMAQSLIPLLERKAGRILVNGWPTGVEVCHAMVHGGPFPATSDSRTTSVGSLAIDRFLRPVSYQNFTASLLPKELRGS